MDILVFTREYADVLRQFSCCRKDIAGMTCFEFGDDLQKAAQLLAQAAGDFSLKEGLVDFLTESSYIYFDGYRRICDEA